MFNSLALNKQSTIAIVLLLFSIGVGISVFVYRSTTQIEEALAEEILQQQHTVSTLIHQYSSVMFTLERELNHSSKNTSSRTQQLTFSSAIASVKNQLAVMRSEYSFARLDGAATAHAFIKPIIEDISDWTEKGIADYPGDSPFVLQAAINRMSERYDAIRAISNETDLVARELISEQTSFLESFRHWMLFLLASFAFLSLAIASLLIRQRNMQAQLAIDQNISAEKHINAETLSRHQAEDALLGSEQFLSATLNSLPSEIAILDSNGIITAANVPWKNFVSFNQQQYLDGGIGQHYEEVFRSTAINELARKGIDEVTQQVANVLNDSCDSILFEYPTHTDDKRQWSIVSMSTFTTGDGRHAVLVHEDVSERKRLEERDRRLQAELAHVSRLTTAGELASGLAHELNQPLTAITHNCDALMSSYKNELDNDNNNDAVETLNDISEQAQRAGSIIRSMRQLVRKECSDKVSVNINVLVKETVRLTGPEAREKGVKVTLILTDNLPNPIIDPVQIQQVLVNLERNSVEAMWQANSPEKNLIIKTGLNSANQIGIGIYDTGPGIDPSFAEHLFTAFQTTKPNGMGLGLSISRTIVEEHGGRLWLDQSSEAGTIFKFTIPFNLE